MPTENESKNKRLQTLQRLRSYWKIEAVNVFWIPGIVVALVSVQFEERIGIPLMLNLIATSWLLIIGTIALRMMYQNALGDRSFETKWIGPLCSGKLPSLLLMLAAISATVWESYQTLPTISANWVACLILALLATAEYINYYHYQLQHFDNLADFKRLLAGKGFRQSHLARAIQRRKSRRQN